MMYRFEDEKYCVWKLPQDERYCYNCSTSDWTAATIRFITQTPRMMKNKGNALTIGFVRAFLVFSENKLRQIRVKRRF